MNAKQRTKLELIRLEGICRMLLQKIEEARLADLIESITKSAPQDVKKIIFRLPRYQLIQIIELAGDKISGEDIDKAYEQYRYGLKPGFTLFSINKKCKQISESVAYNSIQASLEAIPYGEDENIKNVTAKAHSRIDSSVLEFSFFYLIKHSYLTEKEEPAYVYEYEECFAWIDTQNAFLAIKNAPDKVTTLLKRSFSDAYNTQITCIKLTQKLISDVFGNENIKRGSYFKQNASDSEAEKVIIADSRFSEKQAVQDSISGYNMTGTYLNEAVGENENNTLGINCEKGRVYLTSNVSATVFREWSIQRIKDIINYLSDGADYSDFNVFKAKNVIDYPAWNDFSVTQKKLIENICYATYVACLNRQDSAPINCTVFEIRSSMKKYFYERLTAYCKQCDEPFVPRCACGSAKISITIKNDLLCTNCGERLSDVYCDAGHLQNNNAIAEIVGLCPNSELMSKISQTLNGIFGINLSGSLYIQNGKLSLLPQRVGGIVEVNAIPELKDISDATLSKHEYDALIKDLGAIKEKCKKSTNKACNVCLLEDKPLCIMKLFATNPLYRPSPHQAAEFGDISFSVTVNGQQTELMGIAKSAKVGKDVLNLSDNEAREMLQQVLTATHDSRAGIIAAICPMRFHDQLTEELRYISKLSGKPITILDDMFMVKQLQKYREASSSKSAAG